MTDSSDEQTRSDQIRTILSDNIRKLAAGEMTPAEANAISKQIGAELRIIEAAIRTGRASARLEREADKPQLIDRP